MSNRGDLLLGGARVCANPIRWVSQAAKTLHESEAYTYASALKDVLLSY